MHLLYLEKILRKCIYFITAKINYSNLSSREISTPIPGGAEMLFLIMEENVFRMRLRALQPTDM